MIPSLRRQLFEAAPGQVVSGRADQYVQALEGIDKTADGGLVGNVQLDRATARDGVTENAGLDQPGDDRLADAAAPAGDDGDLAGQALKRQERP